MRRALDPFLVGLAVAVLLAWAFPEPGARGGWLQPERLNQVGVALIFFLHGASLPLAALREGTLKWRVHVLVQLCTFLVFPLFGGVLWAATDGWVNPSLRIGLFFLCALPSTVSSSVALTAAARGDVAVAVFNATLSSLLGIVLTPLWLALVLGAGGPGPSLGSVVLDLVQWLLLPLAVGQICRPWIGAWVARHKRQVGLVDRGTILMLVYTSFCDSMKSGVWSAVSWQTVAVLTLLSFVIYGVLLSLVRVVGRRLRLSDPDQIAAMFCGSKKSLATGVPMAQIIFPNAAGLGLILLPIMIYHALQLILSGILASRWAQRGLAPSV